MFNVTFLILPHYDGKKINKFFWLFVNCYIFTISFNFRYDRDYYACFALFWKNGVTTSYIQFYYSSKGFCYTEQSYITTNQDTRI